MRAKRIIGVLTTAILLSAVAETCLGQPKKIDLPALFEEREIPLELLFRHRNVNMDGKPRYETTIEFSKDLEATLEMLRKFAAPTQTNRGSTGSNNGRTLDDEEWRRFAAQAKALSDQWIEYRQANGTTPSPSSVTEGPRDDLSNRDLAESEEEWGDWFKEFMDRVEGSNWGDILKDSQAWTRSMDDVKRWIESGRFRNSSQEWQRWARKFDRPDWLLDVEWPEIKLPELQGGQMPNLPRIRVPRFGGPNFGGGGSVSANWQALGWLLVAAALVAAGWLGWQELARNQRHGRTATRLVPWPVPPDQITTRSELIRAWDCLALRFFGDSAFTWNHRTVAARLAEVDSHPRLHRDGRLCAPVVERLALLYELARYTPGPEELSDEVRSLARADFAFLAELAVP